MRLMFGIYFTTDSVPGHMQKRSHSGIFINMQVKMVLHIFILLNGIIVMKSSVVMSQ
jgi:hypothetical protein